MQERKLSTLINYTSLTQQSQAVAVFSLPHSHSCSHCSQSVSQSVSQSATNKSYMINAVLLARTINRNDVKLVIAIEYSGDKEEAHKLKFILIQHHSPNSSSSCNHFHAPSSQSSSHCSQSVSYNNIKRNHHKALHYAAN